MEESNKPDVMAQTPKKIKGKQLCVKYKKWILGIVCILLLLAATVIGVSAVRANRIAQALNNRIFITDVYHDGDWCHVYAFQDGWIATEDWYLSSFKISGDITSYENKYIVTASPFGNRAKILVKYPDGWVKTAEVYRDENNQIQLYQYTQASPNWAEISLEDLISKRTVAMCDHSFGEILIVQEATCLTTGEKKQICEKCGFEQVETTYASHSYENDVCTVCGQIKELEKADMEPNCWYVYDDILYIQNCVVDPRATFVTSAGDGMYVVYHPICQSCHGIDNTASRVDLKNYETRKVVATCPECGKETVVQFRIGE